jgi:adenosylhomocysteine nucleosidase
VLAGPGLTVVPGGGDPERLAKRLASAAQGADAIISFGMAGALDSGLEIGDWVIGSAVVTSAGPAAGQTRWQCDEQWIAALARHLPHAASGPVYADGTLISEPMQKLAIGKASCALAADMESHIAARAAEQAGLPFAVLRCISDIATHALPPAIAVAMRADGGVALARVFTSILRKPSQVPDMMRTLASFKRAYNSLQYGAQAIGSRLAFDSR